MDGYAWRDTDTPSTNLALCGPQGQRAREWVLVYSRKFRAGRGKRLVKLRQHFRGTEKSLVTTFRKSRSPAARCMSTSHCGRCPETVAPYNDDEY